MTATASRWWPDPRPRRYLSNPVTVSALHYDGSEPALDAIRRWVRRTAPCTAPAIVRVVDQAALLIEQSDADPVQVRAGEFLVHRREGASGRWTSCPADHFHVEYQVLPLELPIYDDGEGPR